MIEREAIPVSGAPAGDGVQLEQVTAPGAGPRTALVAIADDACAREALRILGSRLASGPIRDWRPYVQAFTVENHGMAAIPMSGHDDHPRSIVSSCREIWGNLTAAGHTGRLVVSALKRIDTADDLQVLRSKVDEVAAILSSEHFPAVVVPCGVLTRPYWAFDYRDSLRMQGTIPPVLLNTFHSSGPIPEKFIPSFVAEFLEILLTIGPDLLFDAQYPPWHGVLTVSMESVEAPNSLERRYLQATVKECWMDALLKGDVQHRSKSLQPATVKEIAAKHIQAVYESDRRILEKVVSRRLKQVQADLEALLRPDLLRDMEVSEQALAVDTTALSVTQTGGIRDRLMTLLAADADQCLTLRHAVERQINRMAGAYYRGHLLGQELLKEVIARIDDVHRRQDSLVADHPGVCNEPPLGPPVEELADIPLSPRGSPWRTLFAWMALLAFGAAGLSASLPPVIHPPALVVLIFGPDAGAAARALPITLPIVALLVLWQLRARLLIWRAWRQRARLPGQRVGQQLEVWRRWVLNHEYPRRVRVDLEHYLCDLTTFHDRLENVWIHQQQEAETLRNQVEAPTFPRRLAGKRTTLDGIKRRLTHEYDGAWFLKELQMRIGAVDEESFGAGLRGLFESLVLESGRANHDENLIGRLAESAVDNCLKIDRLGTLDERAERHADTIEHMRRRAHPAGNEIIRQLFVVDPQSRLAGAALPGWQVQDRTDRSRATFLVVTSYLP